MITFHTMEMVKPLEVNISQRLNNASTWRFMSELI